MCLYNNLKHTKILFCNENLSFMKKNNSNCQTVRIKVKNENHRVKLAKLIPNCAMTLKKHMTMATDAHSYKRHTHQKIN